MLLQAHPYKQTLLLSVWIEKIRFGPPFALVVWNF